MQAGLGGHRGTDCECAGHAVCLPVLPEVAPCSGAGTRVQEDAAGTKGALAARGGIGERRHAHREKGRLWVGPCALKEKGRKPGTERKRTKPGTGGRRSRPGRYG